ncbi:MAG: hypothetical protein JNN17_05635 [Verrucomicrobiaceae bacterium]|nr:hypothetical protein [Verrucomicrobiaceae bacterium]
MKNDANNSQTQTSPSIRPEWLQLPKSGRRCPITGLSRSKLNELVLPTQDNRGKPPVLSKSLKSSKWAKRGIRLYNVASLLAWIEAQ